MLSDWKMCLTYIVKKKKKKGGRRVEDFLKVHMS